MNPPETAPRTAVERRAAAARTRAFLITTALDTAAAGAAWWALASHYWLPVLIAVGCGAVAGFRLANPKEAT